MSLCLPTAAAAADSAHATSLWLTCFSRFYADFWQVEDEQVVELLRGATPVSASLVPKA